MGPDGDMTLNLKDNKARHIIPVELNSYLCRNARVLSEFYKDFGEDGKSEKYSGWMDNFRTAIDEVMWNDEKGSWFDYDLINNKQREFFLASNVAPLWANCYKYIRQIFACS